MNLSLQQLDWFRRLGFFTETDRQVPTLLLDGRSLEDIAGALGIPLALPVMAVGNLMAMEDQGRGLQEAEGSSSIADLGVGADRGVILLHPELGNILSNPDGSLPDEIGSDPGLRQVLSSEDFGQALAVAKRSAGSVTESQISQLSQPEILDAAKGWLERIVPSTSGVLGRLDNTAQWLAKAASTPVGRLAMLLFYTSLARGQATPTPTPPPGPGPSDEAAVVASFQSIVEAAQSSLESKIASLQSGVTINPTSVQAAEESAFSLYDSIIESALSAEASQLASPTQTPSSTPFSTAISTTTFFSSIGSSSTTATTSSASPSFTGTGGGNHGAKSPLTPLQISLIVLGAVALVGTGIALLLYNNRRGRRRREAQVASGGIEGGGAWIEEPVQDAVEAGRVPEIVDDKEEREELQRAIAAMTAETMDDVIKAIDEKVRPKAETKTKDESDPSAATKEVVQEQGQPEAEIKAGAGDGSGGSAMAEDLKWEQPLSDSETEEARRMAAEFLGRLGRKAKLRSKNPKEVSNFRQEVIGKRGIFANGREMKDSIAREHYERIIELFVEESISAAESGIIIAGESEDDPNRLSSGSGMDSGGDMDFGDDIGSVSDLDFGGDIEFGAPESSSSPLEDFKQSLDKKYVEMDRPPRNAENWAEEFVETFMKSAKNLKEEPKKSEFRDIALDYVYSNWEIPEQSAEMVKIKFVNKFIESNSHKDMQFFEWLEKQIKERIDVQALVRTRAAAYVEAYIQPETEEGYREDFMTRVEAWAAGILARYAPQDEIEIPETN